MKPYEVQRYMRDYRGDLVPHEKGFVVMAIDHLACVSELTSRIIELLECVHGEFCACGINQCECGAEIRSLGGEPSE